MELKEFKPKQLTGKLQKIDGKVLATVQMAKEGCGDDGSFKSEMTIYKVEGVYCAYVHDNQSIPSFRQVKASEYEFYEKVLLTKKEAHIIVESIHLWEKLKHYHLNPYNVVVLSCLMRGLDLIKKGIIEI